MMHHLSAGLMRLNLDSIAASRLAWASSWHDVGAFVDWGQMACLWPLPAPVLYTMAIVARKKFELFGTIW